MACQSLPSTNSAHGHVFPHRTSANFGGGFGRKTERNSLREPGLGYHHSLLDLRKKNVILRLKIIEMIIAIIIIILIIIINQTTNNYFKDHE